MPCCLRLPRWLHNVLIRLVLRLPSDGRTSMVGDYIALIATITTPSWLKCLHVLLIASLKGALCSRKRRKKYSKLIKQLSRDILIHVPRNHSYAMSISNKQRFPRLRRYGRKTVALSSQAFCSLEGQGVIKMSTITYIHKFLDKTQPQV
jgi:hypothetical protein